MVFQKTIQTYFHCYFDFIYKCTLSHKILGRSELQQFKFKVQVISHTPVKRLRQVARA